MLICVGKWNQLLHFNIAAMRFYSLDLCSLLPSRCTLELPLCGLFM